MSLFKVFIVDKKKISLIFSNSLIPLVLLTFVCSLTEQFIFKNATTDDDRIIFGIFGVTMTFFQNIVSFLIISAPLVNKTPSENVFSLSKNLVIETFRGIAYVMVGILLLVFPGIIRMIRYVLIPFIVVFDPNYEKGGVDVIEEIKLLTKGKKLYRVLFVSVLTLFVVFGLDMAAMSNNIFTTPAVWFLIFCVDVLLSIYIFLVVRNLYFDLKLGRIE